MAVLPHTVAKTIPDFDRPVIQRTHFFLYLSKVAHDYPGQLVGPNHVSCTLIDAVERDRINAGGSILGIIERQPE